MYVGMCFSMAEMSPALPHTGGAYSFGRTAMGPWGGFVTGLAENMEYVLTPAVIVVGIGGYMGSIAKTGSASTCPPRSGGRSSTRSSSASTSAGVELTFKFTVFITFLALPILVVFWIGAMPHFAGPTRSNIAPEAGRQRAASCRSAGGRRRRPALRDLVLSRDRAAAAGGRGEPRPEARHAARPALGHPDADRRLGPDPLPERRHRAGRRRGRPVRGAAVPRLQDDLRRGHGRRPARAGRGRRPGRELPHDHLRLRPQHLFAVARRLFPALDVASPTPPARRPMSR